MYNRWDIWLASVAFEDSPQVKNRPVLIMKERDDNCSVLVLFMTSHPPRDEWDYLLQDRTSAGLNNETVVRTEKLREIPFSKMIHRVGRLDIMDMRALDALLKKRYGSR